jgi:hypothetical protein
MRIGTISANVAAALLTIGLAAPTVHATHFDKDDLKCRKGIAKGFLKAVTTADKTSGKCHKDRQKEKVLPGTDCNDFGPEPGTLGDADPKGKFAKAQQKLIDTPAKKCTGANGEIQALFTSCPADCQTTLGLPNPLTSLDQAVQCLACVAGEVIEDANAVRLGSPDPALMSADDQKCAQSIAKGYAKYLAAILKTRTKCQDTVNKEGDDDLDPTCQSSGDPDGKGKIAKALGKAEGGIDKRCPLATLTNVGSCATTDLTDLKACLAAQTDATDTIAFPAHYQLDATVCPIAYDSTLRAGVGADLSTSATNLESGWNGIGHNQDLVDRYTLSAALTCASGTPPCGTCTVDGIDPNGPQFDAFARCRENTSIACSAPFGTDPVCPGTQDCAYFTGPPLPASSSNVPVCIITRMAADLTGTIDPATGAAEQNLDVRAVVHLGINLTKPCPRCEGDTTPQDGVKDGTCSGGLNDGDPCDIQGFNSTFAVGSGVSLDCPPSTDQNISGGGLALDIPLTTGTRSLPFGAPCDFPLTSLACACGMCSGDTTMTCESNSDCATAGAGTCTSNGGGTNRVPNGCSSFASCTAVGGNKAECTAGVGDDLVNYCNGQLRASGKGLITCDTDADCDVVSSVCGDGSPGSCGDCTQIEQRACFLDPIVAEGVADPGPLRTPVLAGVFCTPPTNNVGVNGASGLPGPSRALIESDLSFRY